MQRVWAVSDNIISPLGFTTRENYTAVREGKTGITSLKHQSLSPTPVYGSRIADGKLQAKPATQSKFEWLCIQSIQNALQQSSIDAASDKTIFILSTTKGNIELLHNDEPINPAIHLYASAQAIATYFNNNQKPLVVSNACISGVMALLVAKRILQSGQYHHAVVIGADILTQFIVSGFQSLNAISAEPCKPFDLNRKGVNLGEAAATIILSTDERHTHATEKIEFAGGGIRNDANHISGPSRTGEELALAVRQALRDANLAPSDINFISAHGTATLYNDEMEAKAFNYAGMKSIPLNSLKGYFGHTLGAAGIVETIVSMRALVNNELVPTFGFTELGVSQSINVIEKLENKKITTCLKTASGFGGCNAAIVLRKIS